MIHGETMQQPDLELKALGSFTGSLHYYNVLGVFVTDGVKYIMENGYSWFVTDAIAAIKFNPRLRKEPFLVVKLANLRDYECDLIIEDGNYNVLYRQHYKFTDARRELKLFYSNNVLMLASEY